MGYEIVYSKQFIKLADGRIIPFALSGSSNCTMYMNGREILERSWDLFIPQNEQHKLAFTEQELVAAFETWTGGAYQEHFKMHSKWVDDAGLMRFVKNGIKGALTLEEMAKMDHRFSVLNCTIEEYDKSYHTLNRERETITTTEHLTAWIAKAEQAQRTTNNSVICSAGFYTIDPFKVKMQAEHTGRVIAKMEHNRYLYEISENGYSYGIDINKALIFESTEEALTACAEHGIRVVSYIDAEKALARSQAKNCVILISNGYYVKKKTQGRLHYGYKEGAQKFTLAEAKKWIEKYKDICSFTFEIEAA